MTIIHIIKSVLKGTGIKIKETTISIKLICDWHQPTNHNHWMINSRGLGHAGTYRMWYGKKKCMHVSVLNFLLTCCIDVTAQNINKLYTLIESASSAKSIINILNTKDTQTISMGILAAPEILFKANKTNIYTRVMMVSQTRAPISTHQRIWSNYDLI